MSADGHHTSNEVIVDGISSEDEPSVGWGWHQHSRKVGVPVGGFFILFLLAMLFGNHIGNVENIWLVSLAAILTIWLVLAMRPQKDQTAKRNRVYELPAHHYALTSTPGANALGAGRGTS